MSAKVTSGNVQLSHTPTCRPAPEAAHDMLRTPPAHGRCGTWQGIQWQRRQCLQGATPGRCTRGVGRAAGSSAVPAGAGWGWGWVLLAGGTTCGDPPAGVLETAHLQTCVDHINTDPQAVQQFLDERPDEVGAAQVRRQQPAARCMRACLPGCSSAMPGCACACLLSAHRPAAAGTQAPRSAPASPALCRCDWLRWRLRITPLR